MLCLGTLTAPAGALAKGPKPAPVPAPQAPSAEQDAADLEKIKQRYWAQGSETEMGVVQNRLYTKQGKVESWVFGGLLASDPFLSIKTTGLNLGYHINETSSFHIMGMRHFVGASSALTTLREGEKEANTNLPRAMVGGEYKASLLYGKLSLLGARILYFDMHFGLGGHVTATETGNYMGPMGSVGQTIYLARDVSLRFDYRMLAYRERIVEKEKTATLGDIIGSRNNFSHTFQIGVSFLWGGKAP
jgi:outer membrane beta-barrel protein